MKSRKEKFIEYQSKYIDIPKDFNERLNWMCSKYRLSDNKMNEILMKRSQILDTLYFESLKIVLYEDPEGTPRPRARLVNRYNALDLAQKNSNFIQVYSVTGAADNNYMKKLISQTDYLAARELIVTPSIITIDSFFKTPSSFNITDTFLSEVGIIRPIRKPDWDNIGKKYSDMYNSNIWLDDDLAVEGTVRKWYSILPRVEITLQFLNQLYNKVQYEQIKKRTNISVNFVGGT